MKTLLAIAAALAALCLGSCVTDNGPNVATATTELAADQKRADYKPPTDAEAMDRARKAVSAKLKDPDSAKFTNLVRRNDNSVCGLVNSKNSFGGYVGNEWFDYQLKQDHVIFPKELGIPMSEFHCKKT